MYGGGPVAAPFEKATNSNLPTANHPSHAVTTILHSHHVAKARASDGLSLNLHFCCLYFQSYFAYWFMPSSALAYVDMIYYHF